MPSEQLDIDSGYDEALRNLRDRVEVAKPGISESQAQEDYYRAVRTYMVVVWLISNAILAMAVSEAYSGSAINSNFYLKFILWSVAGLAFFRAIGSTSFLVINSVHWAMEARLKWGDKMESKSTGLGGGRGKKFKFGSSSGSSWWSGSRIGSKVSSWAPSSWGGSVLGSRRG